MKINLHDLLCYFTSSFPWHLYWSKLKIIWVQFFSEQCLDVKSILKVYCLCQWISDQIWSILHRKFKDHVIWCRFILFILRWTYHYVSLWVKDAESWARKGNIPIWSNTLPFHTIFIFIIIFFLLIHQHLLIMDFTDKMTWSFYCFFFANRAGSAERKKTIEH